MSNHLVLEHGTCITTDEQPKRYTFDNHVRVVLDRQHAYDIMYSLLQQLREEDQQWVQLYFYGKMSNEEETK